MLELLKTIHSPADVKNLSIEGLDELAKEVRTFLIQSLSQTGGHLASNLGVVELTLALHYVFNSPQDKFVWDVGHQAYVHKILTGRRAQFKHLRQMDGMSGFPKRHESEHDVFETGHSSTSISAALGMAKARDLAGEDHAVIAIIGDGALTGGMAFEALNNAGRGGSNLIVILNDNEMSIGKNVGSLSRFFGRFMVSEKYMNFRDDIKGIIKKMKIAGGVSDTLERMEFSVKNFFLPLNMLESLGFKFFGVLDGHNVDELLSTLNKIKNIEGPIFIHVKTQKGKGYSFAEQDKEKFHGISPFNMETGDTNSSSKTYSSIFGNEIVRLGEEDKDIFVISSGMVKGTGLGEFF